MATVDIICEEPPAYRGSEAPKSDDSELSRSFLSAGMPVTFQNITYTVASNHKKCEKVTLLNGVSGMVRPGELSALMGPSGSGKTTLLDLLAGRKTVGSMEGEIRFSGTKPTRQFLRRFTGYVEQFDTLLDILTVEEMLMYTAELKRHKEESYDQKKDAVDELITRLRLESCRHVRIGSPMARGISGGQAKRVNIAISLITNPRVLFLDEPTSGLDSLTANEVMKVVKSLAIMGITVIATIHSPTPFCFNLFDRLLLLLRGNVIYFGPNGKAAIDYFQTQCPSLPGPAAGENPAEWLVELTTQADWQGDGEDMATSFAKSDLKRLGDAEIEQSLQQTLQLNEADKKDLAVKRETVTPFWWALKTFLKYRTLKNYRNPQFLGPRIGDKLVFSLIIFTLYWQTGDDLSSENLPNITSVLFMWTILAGYGAVAYLPALVVERPLFVRELNDGLYRVVTYLCAKMLEELSLAFILSLIFSNLVFWTLNLQGEFLLFWLVYFCSLAIGIVLAYFVAAMSSTMDIANTVLPAYITSLLFFTGLLIRPEDMPKYWQWFSYINFLKYSWGSLMVNQFEGDRNMDLQGMPILNYYSLDGVSKWGWLGIEFCFFVAFFLFAYLALRYRRHVKR